jgi:hypothetical protein
VVAFSVAIPLLAALVLVNRQETFRRRMTKSFVVEAARAVAQLGAVVGVVAGFWHVTWIAGVGMLAGGLVGWRCSRWATGAWNAIACWDGTSSRHRRRARNPATPSQSPRHRPPAEPRGATRSAAGGG